MTGRGELRVRAWVREVVEGVTTLRELAPSPPSVAVEYDRTVLVLGGPQPGTSEQREKLLGKLSRPSDPAGLPRVIVPVQDAGVSSPHAFVSWTPEGGFEVKDLDSTFGTTLHLSNNPLSGLVTIGLGPAVTACVGLPDAVRAFRLPEAVAVPGGSEDEVCEAVASELGLEAIRVGRHAPAPEGGTEIWRQAASDGSADFVVVRRKGVTSAPDWQVFERFCAVQRSFVVRRRGRRPPTGPIIESAHVKRVVALLGAERDHGTGVFALCGPPGAGKHTLLRHVFGRGVLLWRGPGNPGAGSALPPVAGATVCIEGAEGLSPAALAAIDEAMSSDGPARRDMPDRVVLIGGEPSAFRERLWSRLPFVPITVLWGLGSQARRGDDVPALARAFLAECEREPDWVEPAGWDALVAHTWPGNVPELRRVVRLLAAGAGPSRVGARQVRDALWTAGALEGRDADRRMAVDTAVVALASLFSALPGPPGDAHADREVLLGLALRALDVAGVPTAVRNAWTAADDETRRKYALRFDAWRSFRRLDQG